MGPSVRGVLLAALWTLSCDGSTWLDLNRVASFREVPAAEGVRLASQPGAHVLQAGMFQGGAVSGAQVVEAGGAWPAEVADGAPVVILAAGEERGYRLAARMSRAGIQGIVLVSGGVEAWQAESPRHPDPDEIAAAQPSQLRE